MDSNTDGHGLETTAKYAEHAKLQTSSCKLQGKLKLQRPSAENRRSEAQRLLTQNHGKRSSKEFAQAAQTLVDSSTDFNAKPQSIRDR
jgi:hypothetical protein